MTDIINITVKARNVPNLQLSRGFATSWLLPLYIDEIDSFTSFTLSMDPSIQPLISYDPIDYEFFWSGDVDLIAEIEDEFFVLTYEIENVNGETATF